MEELVRNRWCDIHFVRGEREPAMPQPRVIRIDSRKPRKLDLCEVCDKDLLGALLEVLEDAPIVREGGDEPSSSSGEGMNKRKRLDCPVCAAEGESHIVFARSSMRNHFDEQHDIGLIEWESQQGSTIDGKPLPFECDFPGCGLRFSHATGLGAHKRHVHDVPGVSGTATKRRTTKKAAASDK